MGVSIFQGPFDGRSFTTARNRSFLNNYSLKVQTSISAVINQETATIVGTAFWIPVNIFNNSETRNEKAKSSPSMNNSNLGGSLLDLFRNQSNSLNQYACWKNPRQLYLFFFFKKRSKSKWWNDVFQEVPRPRFRQGRHIKHGASVNMFPFMHFQRRPWYEVMPPASLAGDGENKGIEEINSISITEVSSFGG